MSSRIARAARWLAPSVAAAATGALAAGVVEGVDMQGAFGMAAGAGFVIVVVLPVLLVLGIALRAAWHGWSPTVRSFTDEAGRAPLLAGWLVYIGGALAVLGVITNLLIASLARTTTFKPTPVSYTVSAVGVLLAVVLVALSRPAAHGVGALLGHLDAAIVGRRRTLISPRRIALAIGVIAAIVVGALWLWVKPKLGPLDISPVFGPILAMVVAVSVHTVARRYDEIGRWMQRGASLACAALVGCAAYAAFVRPVVALEAWGELPLAGVVIDGAFDINALRDQVSLDAFRPVERPAAEHPDVVVIVVDTVRADRTPAYGGPAPMPFFQELAARGTVFEWAFAPSNVTRRSIPSMFTGLAPDRVKGRVVGWALRVDPRLVLVAERFASAGYDTAGFMCCPGFYGAPSRTGLARGIQHLEIEKNGATLAGQARRWLEKREALGPQKPLFLVMHLLDPHNWAGSNDAPSDVNVRYQLYDRSLAAVDKMIADVVGGFRGRAPERAPIVIITADHGEALGDHGAPFHSTDLYNSQIRVPFVITGPGVPARRVTETVSLTSLAPTLVELAGYEPFEADSASLAALVTGARAPRDDGTAFSAMIRDRSNPGGQTAFVRGKWKLVVIEGRRELYDIHADPNEKTNLVHEEPAIAAELETLLAQRPR